MAKSEQLTTILSGIAGQFFAAAEVSRRGFIATLTLRNTRGVDMLVADADASKAVGVQVKTNQGSKKAWLLNKKDEESAGKDLLYIFVNLNGPLGPPTFHIVPSRVVADYIRKSHSDWVSGRPKPGLSRKDSSMRRFEDPRSLYLNAWHNLSSLLRGGEFSD